MNVQELSDFKKADKIVHKVEDQWHYPIMIKYGFQPETKEGIGFVRSYAYKKGEHKITVTTGVSSDYWRDNTNGGRGGYWADLEPHLNEL